MDPISLIISLLPVGMAFYAMYQSTRLYTETNRKRKQYEHQIKETIQLLYMSRLAFGTFLLAACYGALSFHWIFVGAYWEYIPELSDFTWSILEAVTLAFFAQLCNMGRAYVGIRLDYTEMESRMRLIEGMITASAGFVWQKDNCGVYQFCDPAFSSLFFGLQRASDSPVGFTDVQLVQNYRERTGKTHTFGELCADTDTHCRDQGQRSRYIEYGWIGEDYVMLDVVKTPLFHCGNYVGNVGMAWRITDDMDTTLANIQHWTKQGRLVKLSEGSYYLKDPKEDSFSSFMSMVHNGGNPMEIQEQIFEKEIELHNKSEMLRGLMESYKDLFMYADHAGQILFVNKAYKETFALTDEIIQKGYDFKNLIHPDDLEDSIHHHNLIKHHPYQTRHTQRALTPQGWRWFEWQAWTIFNQNNQPLGIAGSGRDITDRKEIENRLKKTAELEVSAQAILTKIASQDELQSVLEHICLHCERHDTRIRASILIYDPETTLLKMGAAPSLPAEYNALLEAGFPVNEGAGTCGAAAATRALKVVEDTHTDPNWLPHEEFVLQAAKHDLNSCWALPIIGSNGELFGTIANYSSRVGQPSKESLSILRWSQKIAAIAFERNNTLKALEVAKHRMACQIVAQQKKIRDCCVTGICVHSKSYSDLIIEDLDNL